MLRATLLALSGESTGTASGDHREMSTDLENDPGYCALALCWNYQSTKSARLPGFGGGDNKSTKVTIAPIRRGHSLLLQS